MGQITSFDKRLQRLKDDSYCGAVTASEHAALGRRDRKKRQTRAALAAAALRLVAERGLEQVTVEEISEAADVSSRTFFNYFPTKDDALIGDQGASRDELLGAFAAVGPQVSAIEAVRRAMTEAVDEIQADRELWFLRMRVIAENPVLLSRLVTGNAEVEQALTEAIAIRCGVAPGHGYPALVAAVTGAAFRTAMLRWAQDCGARPLPELVDEAFAALAAGLPEPRPAG